MLSFYIHVYQHLIFDMEITMKYGQEEGGI